MSERIGDRRRPGGISACELVSDLEDVVLEAAVGALNLPEDKESIQEQLGDRDKVRKLVARFLVDHGFDEGEV